MRKKKKSVMPILAFAGAWLLYAKFFPLYTLWHFLIAAGFAFAVKGIASSIWKPHYVEIEPPAPRPELNQPVPQPKWTVPQPKPNPKPVYKPEPEPAPQPEPPKSTTGNLDLDAFILEGQRAVSELNRLNDNIDDNDISQRISRLTEITSKIFAHVAANPHKLTKARKFVNYYLPTTIKLLNAYDRLGSQGVEGENISGTMHKIEDTLDTIVTAYEKQLDSFFSEEAMDISADISVLETMLSSEGLSDKTL